MKKIFIVLNILSGALYGQNFWEVANGPFGPNDMNKIFVASNGTIYLYGDSLMKSTDNGNSWTGISDSTLSFQSFIVNNNGDLYGGDFQALYRSTDGGIHWIPLSLGISPLSIQTLASNQNGDVFAGTNNQVFRSTNNGTSWNRYTSGISGATVYRYAFGAGTTVLAACYQGMYRSTNNGVNWTAVGNPLIFRHVVKLKTGTLIAGGDRGMWRSTDDGIVWTNVTSALPDSVITSLGADSSGNSYCMINSAGILRSTNDGITWNNISGNFFYPVAEGFGARSDGNVFVLNRAGLFRSSDNGNVWNVINAQFPSLAARYIFVNPSGTVFIGSSGQFRSTNNGNTWTAMNNGLTNVLINAMEVASNGNLVGGGYGGSMHYSTNNGDAWQSAGITASVNGITKASNGDIYVATGNSVHKSTDNGLSWAPDSVGVGKQYLNCIAVTPNNDLYAGGNFGIWKKGNGEASWTHVLGGTTFLGVSSIVINSFNIVASVNFGNTPSLQGIYRSTDQGVSWPRLSSPDSSITKMVKNSLSHIIAAGKTGIHKSTDNGDSWTTITGKIWPGTTKSNVSVNSLAIAPSGVLFAATSAGVYRSVFSTTRIHETSEGSPLSFSLEQNYPNPFNPSTNITFEINALALTSLKVFDVLGKEIATLVNEELAEGTYQTTFNAQNLSSGVYFYCLRSGSSTQTKSMILMK